MKHLTRWHAVTATTTTVALAAGAFGIANLVSDPPAQPEAIEIAAGAPSEQAEVPPLVTDPPEASPRFDDTPEIVAPAPRPPESAGSVDPPPPRSVDSPSDSTGSAHVRTSTATAPRVQSADSTRTPDSPDSPDSPPSPESPPAPDSPPSADSPDSPESPASVDSPGSASS